MRRLITLMQQGRNFDLQFVSSLSTAFVTHVTLAEFKSARSQRYN